MREWKLVSGGPVFEGGAIQQRTEQMVVPMGSLIRTILYGGEAGGPITTALVWTPMREDLSRPRPA